MIFNFYLRKCTKKLMWNKKFLEVVCIIKKKIKPVWFDNEYGILFCA